MTILGRQPQNVKIDKNGRMVVPSRLRVTAYDEDHVARFHVGWVSDRCLWMHTAEQHREFLDAFEAVLDDTVEHRRVKTMLYGNFVELKTDSAGRIVIPQHLIAKAGLGGEAIVVGMKNRVELWDKEVYAEVENSQLDAYVKGVEMAMARIGERRQLSHEPAQEEDRE